MDLGLALEAIQARLEAARDIAAFCGDRRLGAGIRHLQRQERPVEFDASIEPRDNRFDRCVGFWREPFMQEDQGAHILGETWRRLEPNESAPGNLGTGDGMAFEMVASGGVYPAALWFADIVEQGCPAAERYCRARVDNPGGMLELVVDMVGGVLGAPCHGFQFGKDHGEHISRIEDRLSCKGANEQPAELGKYLAGGHICQMRRGRAHSRKGCFIESFAPLSAQADAVKDAQRISGEFVCHVLRDIACVASLLHGAIVLPLSVPLDSWPGQTGKRSRR